MSARPAIRIRRARVATGLLFLTNGALLANLIPRYPEIKTALGMSDSLFGLSVAGFPLGAMLLGVLAAGIIQRFGSGRIAAWSTLVLALFLTLTVFMSDVHWFGLALLIAGGADAIADVSQNAHGLEVQNVYERSVLNSFHALWSYGAVLGGLMAAGALLLQLPLRIHLVSSAMCFILVTLVAWSLTLPAQSPHTPDNQQNIADTKKQTTNYQRRWWHAWRTQGTLFMVAALVVLTMAEAAVEDAGNSWSALYLSESLRAPSAVAALGFTAMMVGQLIGRSTADRFVDRYGQRTVIRTGGAIITTGMGIALIWPTVPLTLAGFGVAGLGAAALIPAAYNTADELPGLNPGVGLTVVSWFMRLGFLVTPPLVGSLSDMFSLRWALLVVPVAGAVTFLLARVLPGRTEHAQ